MSEPSPPPRGRRTLRTRRTATGPGRVLVLVYGIFAVAAASRAGYQIATRFHEAPLAYVLSAVAAGVYIVATLGLAGSGPVRRRMALVACSVELVGVLAVGTISLTMPQDFPDATVWSVYGRGYGFVPLVLPMLGLFWLFRTRGTREPPGSSPGSPGSYSAGSR